MVEPFSIVGHPNCSRFDRLERGFVRDRRNLGVPGAFFLRAGPRSRTRREKSRFGHGLRQIGGCAVGEPLAEQRVIRVLIVDDDPLFRLGVAAALAGDEQLEFILSEAGDGEAALP